MVSSLRVTGYRIRGGGVGRRHGTDDCLLVAVSIGWLYAVFALSEFWWGGEPLSLVVDFFSSQYVASSSTVFLVH